MKELITFLSQVSKLIKILGELRGVTSVTSPKKLPDFVWPKDRFTFEELCAANPQYTRMDVQSVIGSKLTKENKRRVRLLK